MPGSGDAGWLERARIGEAGIPVFSRLVAKFPMVRLAARAAA